MKFPYSNRLYRQYGLVDQVKLSNLRVLVIGNGPELPYIIANLVYVGVGLSGEIQIPKDCSVGPYIYCNNPLFVKNVVEYIHTDSDVLDAAGTQRIERGFRENDSLFDYVCEIVNHIDSRINISETPPLQNLSKALLRSYDSVIISWTDDFNHEMKEKLTQISTIYTQTTTTASYIGQEPLVSTEFRRNILTESLACVTGGLAVQELMRQNRVIRLNPITKSYLSINFQVKGKQGFYQSLLRTLDPHSEKKFPFQFIVKMGGERLNIMELHPVKALNLRNGIYDDEIILKFDIPDENLLSRMILDNFILHETHNDPSLNIPILSVLFSPFKSTAFENNELKEPMKNSIPSVLDKKTLLILGVGGTGSWLSAIFAISSLKKCTMILIDMDEEVELHNLNRQILFDEKSLGKPKVFAAAERLSTINPSLLIRSYHKELTIETAFSLKYDDILSPDEFKEELKRAPTEEELRAIKNGFMESKREPWEKILAWESKQCDAMFSCVDNRKARYTLSVLSKISGKPMINSGSEEFIGNIDLFHEPWREGVPHTECYVCRYGEQVKTDKHKHSCTGPIPVLQIATTSSIVGGIQTALSMAKLLGIKNEELWNNVIYLGKQNRILNTRHNSKFGQSAKICCPAHLNHDGIKLFD
ncbi:MAG: ThiF family adenylyltransferase [Promethearchaeota archaeon]